jgi:hypothetical protein
LPGTTDAAVLATTERNNQRPDRIILTGLDFARGLRARPRHAPNPSWRPYLIGTTTR